MFENNDSKKLYYEIKKLYAAQVTAVAETIRAQKLREGVHSTGSYVREAISIINRNESEIARIH
jgi:hypothetical protein